MNNINDEFINEKIKPYKVSDFNGDQMYEIRLGLEKGLDISKYVDPKFSFYQMREIRSGMEDELINEKIKPYKVSDFDDYQMYEIREGLEERLDISKYADPKYNVNQMRDIRFGLVQGLNASKLDLTEKLDLITWQIQKSSLSNLEKGIAEEIIFNISDNIDNNYIKEDKLDVNYEKIIEATNNILNIDYLWEDINQEIQNEIDNMGFEPESENEEDER